MISMFSRTLQMGAVGLLIVMALLFGVFFSADNVVAAADPAGGLAVFNVCNPGEGITATPSNVAVTGQISATANNTLMNTQVILQKNFLQDPRKHDQYILHAVPIGYATQRFTKYAQYIVIDMGRRSFL